MKFIENYTIKQIEKFVSKELKASITIHELGIKNTHHDYSKGNPIQEVRVGLYFNNAKDRPFQLVDEKDGEYHFIKNPSYLYHIKWNCESGTIFEIEEGLPDFDNSVF